MRKIAYLISMLSLPLMGSELPKTERHESLRESFSKESKWEKTKTISLLISGYFLGVYLGYKYPVETKFAIDSLPKIA